MAAATAQSTTAAQTAAASSFSSASLYVGDLHPDVSENQLFELFSQCGQVGSVRVCRDLATRRSLGYAYVNFHRFEDAERALDTLNFSVIRGKQCRIMWSHRDPGLRKSGLGNIFVKNLSKKIDNKTLFDTFSVFGNILSCKVATNLKGESLGYGFVHYETEESAKQAIDQVDGKMISDSKVHVAQFKSKKERGGNDKTRFTNVYTKNIPEEWSEAKLREVFGKFGEVNSVFLPTSEEKEKEGKNKGFGFVNFKEPNQAQAAVDGLNNKDLDGKKLVVCRAQKKEERERELRVKIEQLKAERARKYAGTNLYVKNLADTVDDDRLKKEFEKFGSITSAKVMSDEKKKSKGFGFVCFDTPDGATRAVTEMMGAMIDQKPLYVALAQRKEVRRAQLEQQFARSKMAPMQQMQANGPMFPQAQQPLFYPPFFNAQPMMMPRRGPWNQQQQVQQQQLQGMMGVRGPYPMMPQMGSPRMQQQMGGPQQRMGGGRGGRGGANVSGGRGIQQQQKAPMMQHQQMQQQHHAAVMAAAQSAAQPTTTAYKYTSQVRNQVMPAQMPLTNMQAHAAAASSAAAASTAAATTAVATEEVTQQMGELNISQQPLTSTMLADAPEEQRKQIIGERLFPLIAAKQPKLAGKITGMLLEMDNGELLHLLENAQALTDKIEEAMTVLRSSGVEDDSQPTPAATDAAATAQPAATAPAAASAAAPGAPAS